MTTYPQACLVTIGSELLKGKVLNTNAQFLARGLTGLGFKVIGQSACSDEEAEIIHSLRDSLQKAACVILTGGLGPTPDDLTRQAVAKFLNVPLVLSQRQLSFIRRHYQNRGQKMPALVEQEALFPKTATPLFNRYGVALGFSVECSGSLLVVLPGVPDELERMFNELVRPLLQRVFKPRAKDHSLVVRTAGISEPEVMERLGQNFINNSFEFGIYPEIGEVTLRLYADQLGVIRKLKEKIKKRLGGSIFSFEEISLAEAVGRLLLKRKRTLAAAESCTGGFLSSLICQCPGASRYFRGAVTAYSNEAKRDLLNVPLKTIQDFGAGSPQTAREMANGASRIFQTDYGISITGIAGPAGGTKKKPVGLVFIGISNRGRLSVWREFFRGDRLQIQAKAAKRALYHLWREIRFSDWVKE